MEKERALLKINKHGTVSAGTTHYFICKIPLNKKKIQENWTGDNFKMTYHLFQQTLKKLDAKSRQDIYNEFEVCEKKGFYTKVSNLPQPQQEFIKSQPVLHAVKLAPAFKSTSIETSTRIAYDASFKRGEKGKKFSLNCIQPNGRSYANLYKSMYLFNLMATGFISDISKFFSSIHIDISSGIYLMIQYSKSKLDDAKATAESYIMNKVPFGIKCAPNLSNACLRRVQELLIIF